MKRAFSKKNLWENLPPALKSSVGRLAGLIPQEYLLGGDFRKWMSFIQDAETWSLEKNTDFQITKLRHILQLAYEKSEWYKKTFDNCGFNPYAFNDLDEIEKLPLIDKHVINNNKKDILTVSETDPNIDYVTTGGSSGEPLRFYIGAGRSSVEYAYLVSSWYRAGYKLSDQQALFRGLKIEPDKNQIRHFYDPLLRRHYYSNFYMDDASIKSYVEHIRNIGDCYIHTYPSSLNLLVRYLQRHKEKPPENIKGLLVGSENVYRNDREAAEDLFGVRYLSWYGHTEKLVMAAECEHSDLYHVFPTYGYFELVDENGKRVSTKGQTGEIVGTGFINEIMPFIRYRTGDFATYEGDYCSACGRAHTLISNISGHNTLEMLVANDGSLIPWAAVNMHDDTFEGVQQFQFLQEKIGKATLKIVPAFNKEDISEEKIVAHITKKLDGRLNFDIRFVDHIPLTLRGKSVFVDQKINIDELSNRG